MDVSVTLTHGSPSAELREGLLPLWLCCNVIGYNGMVMCCVEMSMTGCRSEWIMMLRVLILMVDLKELGTG